MTCSTTGFSAFKSFSIFWNLPRSRRKTKKMEMRNVCNLSKVLYTKHKVSLYQDQNYRNQNSFALKAMYNHKAGVFVVKKNDCSIAVYFHNLLFGSRALSKAKSS